MMNNIYPGISIHKSLQLFIAWGEGVLTSGALMANKESLIARFSYDTPVKSDYFRAFLKALSILCLWHLHFIYCMYKLSNGNDYMHLDSRKTLEFRKYMRQKRTYPESISFSTLTLIMLWIDQEEQPSPFYVAGLCIVNVHWWRNSDGFLTIFTFGIRREINSLLQESPLMNT